jgi:peptidoglycan/LPS O-acetylase OafA/YrhL
MVPSLQVIFLIIPGKRLKHSIRMGKALLQYLQGIRKLAAVVVDLHHLFNPF